VEQAPKNWLHTALVATVVADSSVLSVWADIEALLDVVVPNDLHADHSYDPKATACVTPWV
jgi:hypothetical protein